MTKTDFARLHGISPHTVANNKDWADRYAEHEKAEWEARERRERYGWEMRHAKKLIDEVIKDC